jgi:hypothetical protein
MFSPTLLTTLSLLGLLAGVQAQTSQQIRTWSDNICISNGRLQDTFFGGQTVCESVGGGSISATG